MPLCPDKPNPQIRSFANPHSGSRRCTQCLVRKPDPEFRWLWTGVRKSSACKVCEKKIKRARRATDGKVIDARDKFAPDPEVAAILARLDREDAL